MFQEIQKVLPESSDNLIDDCWGCGLNLKGLVDRTSYLVFADSQLDLWFFLHWEELWDKVDQVFWGFSLESAIDYRDCFFGGLEREKCLDRGREILWVGPWSWKSRMFWFISEPWRLWYSAHRIISDRTVRIRWHSRTRYTKAWCWSIIKMMIY